MQLFTKRAWTAVGIGAVVLLAAWLVKSLIYGLLVLFAGVLLGVVLTQLSKLIGHYTGMSYKVTFGLVLATLFASLLATALLLGSQIVSQSAKFVSEFQRVSGDVQQQLEAEPWWPQIDELRSMLKDAAGSRQAVSTATSAVTSVIGGAGSAVVILVLGAYFALRPGWYRNAILTLVPPGGRERVSEVLTKIAKTLWYWFLGRMVGMLVIGVGTAIGLWLFDVPLAFTLGVIAGLLTFVPNIGPIVALVPAVLFSMQQGTSTVVYVVIFYLALQTVESYLLTPLIEQHQVSLPPGVTLSAQLLVGLATGGLGLVLATPLAVFGTILLREFYVKDLLGTEPIAETES